MHWFALVAISAVAGKLVQRFRRGNDTTTILEDPAEVRTLARFTLHGDAQPVLAAVASELGIAEPVITESAVRARRPDRPLDVDVVRLVERGNGGVTLELTRLWTGTELGAPTQELLHRIHAVLAQHPAVSDLGWHWRQDRALAIPHPLPA